MRNYALNTEAAKQAENIGLRITESGKYVGAIVTAEAITSQKGTEGVELSFKSDTGQSADYLSMWTHDKDGKELYSFKMLNAIMTCAQVKTLTPTKGKVEKYEGGSKKIVDATVFPELAGKRIGLLLQKAEYQKNDGSIGTKMELFVPFDASTGRTAKEILDRVPTGEALARLTLQCKDKPLKANRPAAASYSNAPTSSDAGFSDDDIPF